MTNQLTMMVGLYRAWQLVTKREQTMATADRIIIVRSRGAEGRSVSGMEANKVV